MSDYLSAYLRSARGETGINSVSCGAACFQIKNPAGGDGAWCYQRMRMLEIFFSGFCHFCYSPSSPSEPICTAMASSWQIDYVNEACGEQRGPRRTVNGARDTLSHHAGYIGWVESRTLWRRQTKVWCSTWGRACITVSSRARIPTAILSSFSTERRGETAYYIYMKRLFQTYKYKRNTLSNTLFYQCTYCTSVLI